MPVMLKKAITKLTALAEGNITICNKTKFLKAKIP